MTEPTEVTDGASIYCGDMRTVLATLPEESVDAVVTDPPYEIGLGKHAWDSTGVAHDPATWAAVLRVLRPGGHLLIFAGARTYHRMACAVEDAGLEVRDQLMWLYGSGMPKGVRLGRAVDEAMGEPRKVVGRRRGFHSRVFGEVKEHDVTAAISELGRYWDNWAAALRPSHEPILLARRPLREDTIAGNVLSWGTGAMNVGGCALPGDGSGPPRWPANVLLDDSAEVAGLLGNRVRFFYSAKASKVDIGPDNPHPTVKPTELMRYLCRLVTPPGGTVLDPFCGSGSTGRGAVLEGLRFVGVELSPQYVSVACRRIRAVVVG